jgi:hypothetical protein
VPAIHKAGEAAPGIGKRCGHMESLLPTEADWDALLCVLMRVFRNVRALKDHTGARQIFLRVSSVYQSFLHKANFYQFFSVLGQNYSPEDSVVF